MTIDAIESNGSNWIELLHSPNYSSAAEQREIKSLMEGAVGRQHAHKLHAIHLMSMNECVQCSWMSVFGLLFYKSIKHTYRHLDFTHLFEYNLNMFTKGNFKSTLTYSNFIWIICKEILALFSVQITSYLHSLFNYCQLCWVCDVHSSPSNRQ